MIRALTAFGAWLMPLAAWACPYCVGNTQGGKDSNTTLILAVFILCTYIPYYVIYRLIKKGRGTPAP